MCLLSVLGSSGDPLKMSLMCIFRGLAFGVPSNSHLLNFEQYSKARPLFHDRPRYFLLEYLDCGYFDWKYMGLAPYTPSW